jgi:hypothetical protein
MGIFGSFKRFVDWKKFKNEKQKMKGACYNCGIEGHFAKKCHKKKQNWNNTFKGSSQIVTTCKTKIFIAILPIFFNLQGYMVC